MSMYTTGELAKKCGVSVRTVQYYDERGILIPSELTEGGRRLFSDKDAATLETICFLRDLGISIKDIASILESTESKDVIKLLLDQQAGGLEKEIKEKKEQLDKIKNIQQMINTFDDASEKSIHDMSTIMEARKDLREMYMKMIIPGAIAEILEIATFIYAILKGNWIPFAVVMAVAIVMASIFYNHWHKRIAYICPDCHTTYKPNKVEAFFAAHTPKTRKLTCPCCKKKVWSIEVLDANYKK